MFVTTAENTQKNITSPVKWSSLPFWKTKQWENLRTKIARLSDKGKLLPDIRLAFRPLMTLRPDEVRVVLLGTTPFDSKTVTPDGFAFSDSGALKNVNDLSPSSSSLYRAWLNDPVTADFPMPRHFCLRHWAKQGVLLWNIQPVAERGASHSFYGEGFPGLAAEILELVASINQNVVIVRFDNTIHNPVRVPTKGKVLSMPTISHMFHEPDKALMKSNLFSSINSVLKKSGSREIDWRIK